MGGARLDQGPRANLSYAIAKVRLPPLKWTPEVQFVGIAPPYLTGSRRYISLEGDNIPTYLITPSSEVLAFDLANKRSFRQDRLYNVRTRRTISQERY